jgi:acetylornithine deacetylase/succinyl-diaminopimelate desuccinylase-like protein
MTKDDPAETRIVSLIDQHRPAQEEFLAELVKVPSDNPPGDCRPHALRAAELLTTMGFTVERHDVPDDLVRRNGMITATNLVVRHRFGDGPVIGLNAHGDVVPPGEGWSVDPFGAVVKDGRMYGRGVAVSKSDFATYAYALKALIDAGAALKGTVELHLTYDEEAGGLIGPGWLLEQKIVAPDLMISAGFAYSVTVAHNGCLHTEVRVEGRSAHAARPDTGVDALEAATAILVGLYAYRKGLAAKTSTVPGIAHPTLVVGLISGGINTNVVPDVVTLRIDRRIIPDENPVEAERELLAEIARLAEGLPGITVSTRRILLAVPFTPVPGQDRLVAAIRRRAQVLTGEDVPEEGVPIYTDARLYSHAGIPTVLYGAGPHSLLEANGHRADENLVLDDLNLATKVIALSILDLLQ